MLDSDEYAYDLSEPNTIYHTSQNCGVDVTKADNIWRRFSEEISDDGYMLVASENGLTDYSAPRKTSIRRKPHRSAQTMITPDFGMQI